MDSESPQTSATSEMDSESPQTSAITKRLKLATVALREAHTEIDLLRQQKTDLVNRLRTMETTFRSKMEAQRSEMACLKRQYEDTKSTLEGCLSTLHSNLQTFVEKTKRVLQDSRYENKLLADQLTVKKLKITHLSRRMESQTKQLARLTRLNTKLKSKDGTALTLNCMRCKVRKNVIKTLETEVVEATATKDSLQSRIDSALQQNSELEKQLESSKADVVKSRDQVLQLRRNNAVLEQELREEREKSASFQLEAQTAVVEVGRTPTDQQPHSLQPQTDSSSAFDHFSPSTSIHARCEQYLTQVRSRLESKSVELNEAVTEKTRAVSELAFYQRRCEDMTLDLENRTVACDQKQTELDAANQQVQILQALLQNLAAGVFTAMVD